jgi:hypothetical protein
MDEKSKNRGSQVSVHSHVISSCSEEREADRLVKHLGVGVDKTG